MDWTIPRRRGSSGSIHRESGRIPSEWVGAINRYGWAESIGMGGRLPSEWVGGINRNHRADWLGIRRIARINQDKLTALQERKLDLIHQYARDCPELASLENIESPKLAEVQEFLPPECVLLEYFHTGKNSFSDGEMNELWIFIITHNSFSLIPFAITQEELCDRIETYLSYFAKGPKPEYEQATDKLYECLLKPVQDRISSFKTLIIAPWKTMCYVPFAALAPEGGEPLGTYKSVVTTPSAGTYRYILPKRSSDRNIVYAIGNPRTEYSPLPSAEAEAKTVSALFKTSTIILGDRATETAVKSTDFSDTDVVHFACHGLFDEMHPELSCLLLCSDPINDGRLEMHEVFDLPLRGVSLVTLSACSTGKSGIGNGEEILGLTRGFLFAGAPSILCTLWPVADEATSTFMEAFYRAYTGGLDKCESLQHAQRELAADPRYTHPYFWAPFALWGDWQ